MGNFKTSLNESNDTQQTNKEPKSLIGQLKKKLGDGYHINTENTVYDCEINKAGKRNIVCLNFQKKIVVTYLRVQNDNGTIREWGLYKKIVPDLYEACAFIKSYYN